MKIFYEAPYRQQSWKSYCTDDTWQHLKFYTIAGIIACFIFFVFALLAFSEDAHAEQITDKSAIRAIIGEAASEGYRGMLGVACAIRNRGSLKGVYGLQAKHVNHEPAWVWKQASKAWKESANRDIVNGATHWEMSSRTPWWTRAMTITARINNHIFYR